jgi:hypothetical protein
MSPLHIPLNWRSALIPCHTGILVCYAPGSEEALYNTSLGHRSEIPSSAAETSDGNVLGTSRDAFPPGSYGLVCDVQATADRCQGWAQALVHDAGCHDIRTDGAIAPLPACGLLSMRREPGRGPQRRKNA